MLLGPATLTVVAGVAVADGAKLEKILKELVDEIAKGNPEAAKSINLNAETYRGVRFHTLVVCNDEPKMKMLMGESPKVVLGISDKQFLVAAGRDASKTLKRVIDQSQAAAGKEVPPLSVTLDSATIAEFIAQVADDEEVKSKAAMVAGFLQAAGKKDHVTHHRQPHFTGRPRAAGI